MRIGKLLLRLALALVAACLIEAARCAPDTNATGDRILQQELKQQQLQKTTHRVGEQLSAVIKEFEENAISGEDVRTLKAIQGVLGRLSEKDMLLVIELLSQARSVPDTATSRQRLAGAYSGQKTILTLLKQLILEYERQQALYELSIRFREMAARQTKNMRAGAWLVRNNEQQRFNDEQKLLIQMQHTDQMNIREETVTLADRLAKVAAEANDTTTGERPKAAAARVKEGRVLEQMNTATDHLKAYKLLDATGVEKHARDELREVARLLLLSKDLMDLLRVAISETEAAIMLQKQVIEETRLIAKREDGLLVQDHQLEVVDAVSLIRHDVLNVAPSASTYLRDAEYRMQDAGEILVNWDRPEKKRTEAPLRQNEALTHLELAKRALLEQLDRAEREANQPEQILANLRQLQEEVRDLIKKEEEIKQRAEEAGKKSEVLRATAAMQGEVRDRTQDAQKEAASDSPPAARALAEASREMENSQKAMARGQNAPENQQAAIEALKQADQELGQQIAKLEAAEKQLAQLEQLSDKVGELIKGQEQANLDTAKESGKKQPDKSALSQLANREKNLATQTAQARQEAAQASPAATPHLAEARAQMDQAGQSLQANQPTPAQPAQNKALNELFAAKKEIDNQIKDLQAMLGETPSDQAQLLADAAAKLQKAQAEVADAMAHMSPAPPGLMDQLKQQQEKIASDLADQAAQTSSQPKPTLKQAQEAATSAARELARGRLPEAVDAMKKAQEGIRTTPKTEKPSVAPTENSKPSEGQTNPPRSMADIGKDQAEVKRQAEDLLAAQQAVPANEMDAAAQDLGQAATDATEVASGELGVLPPATQAAVQSAVDSLNKGTAQARARQQPQAQSQAQAASDALARALASLALAQAGLGDEMAQSSPQQGPPGGQPKQGGKPGQQPGQQPGRTPGKGIPPPRGTGQLGNVNGAGATSGALRNTTGAGSYMALPARDRAAIQQSRSENYPQEYGPLVEQYMKNLSDQTGQK